MNIEELRKAVMSSLEEFSTEMRSTRKEIANQALNHVIPSDRVLTLKFSDSSTLNVSDFSKSSSCFFNF